MFERRFAVGEIVGRYALQMAIVLLGFTLQFDQLWTATEGFAPLVSSYVAGYVVRGLLFSVPYWRWG